jgi:hypothetical protein
MTGHPEVGLFGVNLTRNDYAVLLNNSGRSWPQGRNADYTDGALADKTQGAYALSLLNLLLDS